MWSGLPSLRFIDGHNAGPVEWGKTLPVAG